MKNILEVNNICFSIDNKEILKDISFSLCKGAALGIAGESGAGKTTIAKIIAGLLAPSSGHISKTFPERNNIPSLQILFQNNGEIINPFRDVWDMVEEVVKIKNKLLRKSESDRIIKDIMEALVIDENLWHRKGYELSGGEQQRTALARILAYAPDIIVLDEPFSAQDPESNKRLINIFNKLNKDEGITLICISHKIELLKKFCSDYIILSKGSITDKGDISRIEESPDRYTKFLLNASKFNIKLSDYKSH